MEYLITPKEPTSWSLNESDFKEHLKKKWSKIEIHSITNLDDFYSLEWTLQVPTTEERLDGALHRDGQGISLDGYIQDCAIFAIWFRSLVPQTQELLFYDQAYNFHVELQPQTIDSEIIQLFSAPKKSTIMSG
jgi:hypothetical protein